MKGIFIISLDFELHWGGFEKWKLPGHSQSSLTKGRQPDFATYFLNTREVIPGMLKLFEAYGIHVTWATVGMLFHRTREELLNNVPALKPTYQNTQLSAYQYLEHPGIGENERQDPFHFAPSLVDQIKATPNQELGTHTFGHYYCNEAGQNISQFRDDLRSAQRIAKEYGVVLRSLVFPRNQFNDDYLKVCFEEGITSVRSNPLDWFWQIDSTQDESIWKRLNRGLDAYIPVGKKNTYSPNSIIVRPGFPVSIPASRLLRPYRPKELILNSFKIQRIFLEMDRAARQGEVYHLWWHPHNFGNFPQESMDGLTKILGHYQYLNQKYGMESYTMGELADKLTASR